MKFLLIILIFMCKLFSYDIDEILIIDAKLFPKIVMLNQNIKKENLKIGILTDKKNEENAKKLKKYLGFNGYRSYILKDDYFFDNYDAYIVITERFSMSVIKKIAKNKKLIFGAFPESIKFTMISIYVGTKIKPILNLSFIRKSRIKINPILIKVSKIYESE